MLYRSLKFATQVHLDSGLSLSSSQVMLNQERERLCLLLAQLSLLSELRTLEGSAKAEEETIETALFTVTQGP